MIEAIQMEALEMLLRQAGYDIAEDSDGKGKVIFNEEAGIHWGPYPENPWGSALKDMVEAASYPGRQECPMCGPRSSRRKRKMISREKRREYVKAGGSFCINCGSGNISAGKIESEGREAWQPVQCYDCGSEWNDIFRLIGVDDIILPEDDPMIPVVFDNKESADGHPETA